MLFKFKNFSFVFFKPINFPAITWCVFKQLYFMYLSQISLAPCYESIGWDVTLRLHVHVLVYDVVSFEINYSKIIPAI